MARHTFRHDHSRQCASIRRGMTLDDGPDPHYTPLVLKVLAKHHAKATFFMVGERVLQYPDLVKQAVSEVIPLPIRGVTYRIPTLVQRERHWQLREGHQIVNFYNETGSQVDELRIRGEPGYQPR